MAAQSRSRAFPRLRRAGAAVCLRACVGAPPLARLLDRAAVHLRVAPRGQWPVDFWSTEEPQVSCNRYAGEMISHTAQTPIAVSWPGDWTLRVTVDGASLTWDVALTEPPSAGALNAIAGWIPARLRRAGALLRILGPVAPRCRMGAAMVLPVAAIVFACSLGIEATFPWFTTGLTGVAMFLGMLGYMLYRHEMYTGGYFFGWTRPRQWGRERSGTSGAVAKGGTSAE